MLEEEKKDIDHIISHTEEYLKTQQELIKLVVIEKSSIMASAFFSTLIIFMLFFFVFIFASVYVAYVVSEYYEKASAGFAIISLFYLIIGILLYLKREKLLKKPVMNSMIKNLLHHDQN